METKGKENSNDTQAPKLKKKQKKKTKTKTKQSKTKQNKTKQKRKQAVTQGAARVNLVEVVRKIQSFVHLQFLSQQTVVACSWKEPLFSKNCSHLARRVVKASSKGTAW